MRIARRRGAYESPEAAPRSTVGRAPATTLHREGYTMRTKTLVTSLGLVLVVGGAAAASSAQPPRDGQRAAAAQQDSTHRGRRGPGGPGGDERGPRGERGGQRGPGGLLLRGITLNDAQR